MLVEKIDAELIGYLSADDVGAGFIVPLFSGRSSNMMMVQVIDSDGRVSDFRKVDPKSFQRLPAGSVISTGQPALWGFRKADGTTLIDQRHAVRRFLTSILDSLEPPFLKLQAAQFCESADDLVQAWRTAYEHLDERSPRSARAWRDVVIIPAQMRLAVEHALIEQGLHASVNQLPRSVEVVIRDGALELNLSPSLHEALMHHPGARGSLERLASPVRRAFGLSKRRIKLLSDGPPSSEEIAREVPDEVAVAGFGDMAVAVLKQIAPRPERAPRIYYPASPLRNRPRPAREMALLQRDEFDGKVDWQALGPSRSLSPQNRVLLVVFQLDAACSQLAEAAIEFAIKCREKQRRIVAVIPHLPNEFDDVEEPAKTILPMLNKQFDAVWALSDRSPHLREALPYGPSCSIQATAAHLHHLLRLAQHEDLRQDLLAGESQSNSLNVIASATGDRKIASLAEHAMARMAHHLLDFQFVDLAIVGGCPLADSRDAIEDLIRRESPEAKLQTRAVVRASGGPERISVALKNVALQSGGAKHFEHYCVQKLERYGWEIDQFEPDGPLHISRRDLDNIPADCKLISAKMLETAMRTRQRRRYDSDAVLLTNANIRRRSFAVHVLNGTVPVHSSRIEALQRIYRRRYAYVLTYLLSEKQLAKRLVVPAALDWVTRHHWVDSKNIGKPRIVASESTNTVLHSKSIKLEIPLEFVRGRGSHSTISKGEAHLTFDEDGWHLEKLSTDGSHLQENNPDADE